MSYVGIDPGYSGAICLMADDGAILNLWDMPITGGKARKLDWTGLAKIEMQVKREGQAKVYVEKQWARPLQGLSSTAKIMAQYGALVGYFRGCGHWVYTVSPMRWKAHMLGGKGLELQESGKELSVAVAELKWPDQPFRGPRGGLEDGRAEACLIAEHGRTWAFKGKGEGYRAMIEKRRREEEESE